MEKKRILNLSRKNKAVINSVFTYGTGLSLLIATYFLRGLFKLPEFNFGLNTKIPALIFIYMALIYCLYYFVPKFKNKQIKILLYIYLLQSCAGLVNMKPEEIQAPFDGTRFENIEPFQDKSLLSLLKWRLTSKRAAWKSVENQSFHKPSLSRSKELRIIFIGHSTVLIQINNINILTDPHYSERSSPISWAGPKRVIQPAIKFQNLPPIDVVLLSHNHYDHMDLPTLKRLSDVHKPVVLVGLGNATLLKSQGIINVHELDWWESFEFKQTPIYFTPVQHWSARGVFDKRKTLWGGFYIEASKKIFFAGDTGYGKVFKMIHEKFGDMDVGLIPIGAYKPRWFMKDAHINPEEAVKVFKDLKLKNAIGIHFATFEGLTDEAKYKPAQDLKAALKKNELDESSFIAPDFGIEYLYK